MCLFVMITCAFGQNLVDTTLVDSISTSAVLVSEEVTTDYSHYFATFAALVALVPIVVEAIKRVFPKINGLWTQILSWVIGIIIVYFGWFFDLGCLVDLNWWQTLLYGLGISLAANGIADTGIIEWIVNLFCSKAQIENYNRLRNEN